MKTTYRILFTVEMLHDYYNNLQCTDFDIIPSDATIRLMKNRQMMFKNVGNKLIVMVKVKTDAPDIDKPFIDLNPDDKFLFYLQLNNTKASIISNFDVDKLRSGRRYYFTNLYENDLDDGLSLTSKIEAVAGAAEYVPGDFTADGANTVYECIKSTDETNNPPNAVFWQDRGKQQYVSGADMLPLKSRFEEFTVTNDAKEFTITVSGFNRLSGNYDKNIPIEANFFTSDTDTSIVQAKLTELPAGRYTIDINTQEFNVFVDDTAVHSNVFGIIEIFSHFANGTDFAFLDINGKVKDVSGNPPSWLRYKIRFANRMAYWQYNTPRHGVTAITDLAALYSFNPTPAAPGDKDFFTSDKPIPLLESPWKFKVNVISLSNDEDPLAPNPDPDITGMLRRTENDKDYFCTITLNY